MMFIGGFWLGMTEAKSPFLALSQYSLSGVVHDAVFLTIENDHPDSWSKRSLPDFETLYVGT